ncbi:general transcription factor 3C polypeptide 1 isoform X1 [Clarias magur]|uniref:General transcription factor 3C polypeptide 1 isoform X1 n=1 Tax=Clarias magur TaxID=1594786 RepID=A0A8J4T3P4_CLAMG|nr:general transcription factor 3C polypeptide 1 isoform X1 [Clarias magur]
MDALALVLDEVALEGLDGITLSSLWVRLQGRQPPFPLSLDPLTREYVWRFLVSSQEEVAFYLLPRDRPPVTLHDRFQNVDPDTGIQELRRLPGQNADVYPPSVVQDDPGGIQGSCLYYRERQDVNSLIRTETNTPRVTLQEAHAQWGEKLVMVASQQVRIRALIGPEGNPELRLSDLSYCILERLGRARWQGELQKDLQTIASKLDSGKIHYLRKSLDKNGLITMQSHVIRLPTGAQQYSILLLLKRFHVDRRSKYDILMELTSNLLSELPNNIGIMIKLRDQLHICERTFKKMFQYMQAAKMVSIVTLPLQELNPEAGPCKTKRGQCTQLYTSVHICTPLYTSVLSLCPSVSDVFSGTDIRVRCLKLLKPYKRNQIDDDDDDENNDEEGDVPSKRSGQAQPRDIERDLLSQAYDIVVTTGPKGISKTALRERLNIGKLESRMVCRVLERNQMIKGFMEDEGRQRTTKYISKLFVEKSKLNLDFTKEKERSEKLRAPQEDTPAHTPEDTPASELDTKVEPEEEELPVKEQKSKGKAGKKSKSMLKSQQKKVPASPLRHSTPLRKKQPARRREKGKSSQGAELSEVEERDDPLPDQDVTADHTPSIINEQSQQGEESVMVVEEFGTKPEPSPSGKKKLGSHQTYRLLKRKNIIIEAVRNLKVIEGLYTLQKKLMDEERQEGVNTKVCKKSILRLIRTLYREGFVKMYRTTVIQDGVTKKVEFVVHPSIAPDDPLVRSAIEQVRFKISSSYTVHRLRNEEERAKAKADSQDANKGKADVPRFQGKTEEKMGVKELKDFKPSIIPGLSRSLGYQPKMPRLRMVQTFLWYLIYGHPLNAAHPSDPNASTVTPDSEVTAAVKDNPQSPGTAAEQEGADTTPEHEKFTVYTNELSWKRFVPPLPLHREFGYGWALTSDVLISLPLSVYVQVIQISFKVDGLEEFLNDPVKQHYLIRFLPSSIKTRLLHRRKYFFSFFESLQKLCYMGLLQFGPTEKFMDKDQYFFFLKRRATIVDTSTCEPHYNLVIETRPFERRHYSFNTFLDVENYWFDLMCVCLNTPLGVIRPRTRHGEGDAERQEAEPDTAAGAVCYDSLQYTLKGSCEVVDDGVTPGDGQGAGGLDSSFFSHLKRNWLWTTYLLSKRKPGDTQAVRLRNLLSKNMFSKSGCTVFQGVGPPAVLDEEVQVGVEPSSRNQQVRGGKRQKRKRLKKDVVKAPKKRRKVRRQRVCHDETDRKAMLRMTRQRVLWTHLEDSILMLCRVTSHFLNRKIKRAFVGWNVVRDILHRDLELSLDKTTLAVSRRSRYIMKNPQTQLNYRTCLAEVYQDKALIEEFMNRTNDYTDPVVCAEEFNEFVSALRTKFSSSCGSSKVVLPDTKEELFNKFKVYTIGEEIVRPKDVLNSVEDIDSLVLDNLIQSTLVLSNTQMKTCLAFQLFSLYSRYNQEVLQQVFLSCKKRGLMNRRRANKLLGPKKGRAIPCLPMSYQLSQQYYRYFSWRFPSMLYNDVFDLLEALCRKGRVDRPNTFSFQREKARESGEGRGVEIEDECLAPPGDVEDLLDFSMDSPGGATACCLTLLTLGLLSVDVSIPQQIVVVDSTLVDNEVVKSFTKELDEEEDDDEGGTRIEVKAHQASHTNYLLMKGYVVPGIISLRNITSTEHIAVNACSLRIRLRSTHTHSLFTHRDSTAVPPPSLPSFLSRVFDKQQVSGRDFLEEHVSVLGYTCEDVEAVQEVMGAVETGAEFGITSLDLYRKCTHLEHVDKGRSKTLQQYIQDLLDCGRVLEVGGSSPRLVCLHLAAPWLLHCRKVSKDPWPLSLNAPPTAADVTSGAPPPPRHLPASDTPRLKRPLDRTDDDADVVPPVKRPNMESVAMGTGVSGADEGGVKTVSPASPVCVKEEVTHSDEATGSSTCDGVVQGDNVTKTQGGENTEVSEEDDVLSFVARPWRVVDGSLNSSVFKGMLEALLLHIMTLPGVPEPALLQHYSEVLQPVVVLDLLKVLEELGCVTKRFTMNQPKASLFSRPGIPKVKGRGEVGVTEDAVPFYEPTVDCSVIISKLFPHEPCWNRWVQLCAR